MWQPKRIMAKIISIFNHKGGVSKTTTTFNIGWQLSRLGKRVLLVDADSQCNLSLYMMGEQNFSDFYAKEDKNNIKDALEPAFKSKPRLIEPVNCYQHKGNDNLFLLPGHLDLSENEVQLGLSFQLNESVGALANLPGSFNYLFNKVAEKYKIEYILIDMNPSLSSINQDLIVNSDFFLVPTSPDTFSYMSIRSLSRILPTWERWARRARAAFVDAEYPMSAGAPKFLGFTINDFNLSHGRPTSAFARQMDNVSDAVEKELVPALQAEGMLLPDAKYDEAKAVADKIHNKRAWGKYCRAEISNFNKLIALSYEQSKPVFELNVKNLAKGQERTLNWFQILFENIAKQIIVLTQ